MNATLKMHEHHHMMNTASPTTMGDMSNMHNHMDHMNHMENMNHMNHMDHMGNDTDSCSGMMMMYFHTGHCEYVLFETLKTTKVGEIIGACFAIFALAILYEGLKVLREHLLQKSLVQSQYVSHNTSQDAMVIDPTMKQATGTHMLSCGHFIQTLLHMLQVFISYCLMLVFMTYNVWLCIAVVVGAGVGYFLFGWRRAIVVDINEHCH